MPEVKDVIDSFNRLYKPDDYVAVAIWCEADVIEHAAERNMTITSQEARQIIDNMHNNHDSELGITWDTIDAGLDELKNSPYR